MQGWQGPLPPPDALRAFEEVHPGAAGIIVSEFQTEAAHRRTHEAKEADYRVREGHIGQASALLFGLSCLGVAGYSAFVGAQWIGSIIGGGVIVSGMVALLRRPTPPPPAQPQKKP